MKLSGIVFLGGVSSLMFTCLVFWQRSAEGGYAMRSSAIPKQQLSLTASAVQPTPTSTPIAVAPTVPVQPATPVVSAVPAASPAPIAQANLRTIATCNGQPGSANFRSAPSLAPSSILGVVAQGEAVALTGRTAIGDGEFWHEAIAPSPLYPSTNPAALNQKQAGQTGWIAACFVDR